MTNKILKTTLQTGTAISILLGIAILLLQESCTTRTPQPLGYADGWLIRGDQVNSYEMGSDKSESQDGNNSASIKSIKDTIDGFGTLMQTCMPNKFIGQRVKMTGYIKTENVKGWAGLWLRVDCDTNMVSFDNMHDGKTDKSIKGTTKWTRYEIVLDVPSNATLLAYGGLLSGTGQIWFDNMNFELVDNSVETTGMTTPVDLQNPRKQTGVLLEPYNLSFEE